MKKSILTLIFSLYTIVSFSQAASNFTDATGEENGQQLETGQMVYQ